LQAGGVISASGSQPRQHARAYHLPSREECGGEQAELSPQTIASRTLTYRSLFKSGGGSEAQAWYPRV